MNSEDLKLYKLIKLVKENDKKAIFEIINMFDNYINKNAYINGKFNQECKDFIIEKLLIYLKKFKNLK